MTPDEFYSQKEPFRVTRRQHPVLNATQFWPTAQLGEVGEYNEFEWDNPSGSPDGLAEYVEQRSEIYSVDEPLFGYADEENDTVNFAGRDVPLRQGGPPAEAEVVWGAEEHLREDPRAWSMRTNFYDRRPRYETQDAADSRRIAAEADPKADESRRRRHGSWHPGLNN